MHNNSSNNKKNIPSNNEESLLRRSDYYSNYNNSNTARTVENNGSSRQILALSDIQDEQFDIVIDNFSDEPTSVILNFCTKKFLKPYVFLLGLVGLYPNSTDITTCRLCCTTFQSILIITLSITGYILQYFTSFRRDRGFTSDSDVIHLRVQYKSKICNFTEMFFAYILPSIIHLLGYIFAIYVFRIDNEHFENLVERVFLMSSCIKKLCIKLWLYVFGGFIWLSLLLCYLIISIMNQKIIIDNFEIDDDNIQNLLKGIFITTLFIHDLIQMIVLTSYCIECYLLRLHLFNLKEKLLQHTISSLDWMREVLEFRKLLDNLNHRITTPVSFFTILNLSYALSAIIYLFKDYDFDSSIKIFILNTTSITIWLIIGLLPFFQAAAVTRVCRSAQEIGHQIRIRPFVHHQTSEEDLNSTLLFASSLNMSANLFRMPVHDNYLCFAILIISIFILTLGMCLNVPLGIIHT